MTAYSDNILNPDGSINREVVTERVTTHRRELHKIPELNRYLPLTRKYLADRLEKLDCEITSVITSGLCVFFDFGFNETIALRSDMDALPLTEKNTCEYCSHHDNAMHACGHDGHMAMLLTFAELLGEAVEFPKFKTDANILLIFQPAEETTGGAKEICDEGILKKYNVTGIFGFHLWPFADKGLISSIPGPMMAKSSEINIEIYGKSAHCTAPEKGIDALAIGCRFLNELYDMPEIQPDAPSLMKFGKMESGTVRNAISDSTRIEGTLRCLKIETFNKIIEKMDMLAEEFNAKFGCEITVHHSEGYPPVTNDEQLYAHAVAKLKEQTELIEHTKLNEHTELEYRELLKPSMIAEDFSFYQLEVPGVFFFLGTGTGIPLHSTVFDFDESILLNGVLTYKVLCGLSINDKE